jgi:hypothetical protein
MSLFDMFRSSNAVASEGMGQQGGEGQQQPQQQTSAQTNPTVPNSGEAANTGGEGEGEVSGLDAFKDLWNNESTEGEEGDTFDPSSSLNVDPKAIQEAVSQIDFSQVLDKETLSQISEGGEGAQQAFAKSMNSIAQHVFSQSMIANATMVKQALSNSTGAVDGRIKNQLRQSKVSESVRNTNPEVYNHPSVAPIMEAMEGQLLRKYPTASPEEISQKANQWFEKFADEIAAPKRKQAESKSRSQEMDWEAFFAD